MNNAIEIKCDTPVNHAYIDGKGQCVRPCEIAAISGVKYRDDDWMFVEFGFDIYLRSGVKIEMRWLKENMKIAQRIRDEIVDRLKAGTI